MLPIPPSNPAAIPPTPRIVLSVLGGGAVLVVNCDAAPKPPVNGANC